MTKTLDFNIFGGIRKAREIKEEEYEKDPNWIGFCLDKSEKYHLVQNQETNEYGYIKRKEN